MSHKAKGDQRSHYIFVPNTINEALGLVSLTLGIKKNTDILNTRKACHLALWLSKQLKLPWQQLASPANQLPATKPIETDHISWSVNGFWRE